MDRAIYNKCNKIKEGALVKKQPKYLKIICQFSKNKQSDIFGQIGDYIFINPNQEFKRLWALFGKPVVEGIENKSWVCLEVGSSKDIKKEIRSDLNSMFAVSKNVKKGSAFFQNLFEFDTYKDRTSLKYKKIYNICSDFIIYEVDINEFTNNIDTGNYPVDNYAEVKFAIDYKALFWNPSPAVYGNKEMEILNEFCYQRPTEYIKE